MYDAQGRTYLDFMAGIAVNALGHADPQVAQILHEQANTLLHLSNLYHHKWSGQLAKLLVEGTKEAGGMKDASKIFFANSGTEANEGALKFARKWGKHAAKEYNLQPEEKIELVSFNNAFHGRSMGALSATAQPKYQAPFAPLIPGCVYGTYNDIEALKTTITEKTCGVIIEPIQGEGGVLAATDEFMVALRKRCDEVGAVLIYDEIQCGLGRTGKLWGHQHLPSSCQPDILTMAKPLANGVPIGAIMTTERVADIIKIGDHGTTFGGNPLACRVAHHVLGRIMGKELSSHVNKVSKILDDRINKIAKEYPDIIETTRGKGLMRGIAFKEGQDVAKVVPLARERGLLVITCGNNTLRLVPPLVITEAEVNRGMDILESALQAW